MNEIIDAVKVGLVEMGFTYPPAVPRKIPLATAIDLPFAGPTELTESTMAANELRKHPALVKEFEQWNAFVLFSHTGERHVIL